jgi:excisionase family DNA binding protein
MKGVAERCGACGAPQLPYLSAAEAAAFLRKSTKAVWAMVERGQLPGVRKIGRRILVRRRDLVAFIEKSALSPKGEIGR